MVAIRSRTTQTLAAFQSASYNNSSSRGRIATRADEHHMIHVEKLTKEFDRVCAVNNVSFQVEQNEIVGLLGNNGAGKTTIMRILTTYLPASSGVARVAGFDVMTQSMEVRRRV